MIENMKAAVIEKPGIVRIMSVPKPEPEYGEVLLKIEACALCGTDQRVLVGEKHVDVPIVGHEITGKIEKTGTGVSGYVPGQRFVVQTVIGCGKCQMCKEHRENLCENTFKAIGYQYNGGFAEYMVMPKEGVNQGCLIPIPDIISAEEGTVIEPLSCCVNGMSYMPMEKIDHMLIFGGGIIGVLNGLVARAKGAKRISIMDVSEERLDLLRSLSLPFDDFINSKLIEPAEWVSSQTKGCGVNAVVVAASVKSLVTIGLRLLARAGHLSIFAGMPKSDPIDKIDYNLIHYRELNVHGANSSAISSYIEARDLIISGKISVKKLITHRFKLDDFSEAVKTQSNPSSGALKVIIIP